jgi:hypothetical protein
MFDPLVTYTQKYVAFTTPYAMHESMSTHLTVTFNMIICYRCLDVLGIKHGPTHTEVMMLADGPCLVEVGARFHGVGSTFMMPANICVGYNQVSDQLPLNCCIRHHTLTMVIRFQNRLMLLLICWCDHLRFMLYHLDPCVFLGTPPLITFPHCSFFLLVVNMNIHSIIVMRVRYLSCRLLVDDSKHIPK